MKRIDDDIRIVFFDIDGTLIDMETKQITDRMIKTLQELKANGFLIGLATGRGPLSVPHFDGVEFDVFLTYNGSYCYEKDKTLYSRPIPKNDVEQLLENAAALGRPVSLAGSDRLVCNGADQDLIDYYAFSLKLPTTDDDFDEYKDNNEIYQVMLGLNEKEYDRILEGVEEAKLAVWWDRAADIIPKEGGKGEGIRQILKALNLKPDNAVAFGDGNNDLEMFEAVGKGIAMDNGSDQLKAAAFDIAPSVGKEGVTEYCRYQGWIE